MFPLTYKVQIVQNDFVNPAKFQYMLNSSSNFLQEVHQPYNHPYNMMNEPVWSHSQPQKLIDPDDFFEKYDVKGEKYDYTEPTTDDTTDEHSPRSYMRGESDFTTYKDSDSFKEIEFIPLKRIPTEDLLDDLVIQPEDTETIVETKINADNNNLKFTIDRILEGIHPNEFELARFTELERVIIEAVIEKKKLTEANPKNHKKREEEKQKMFFKGVLKYTEQKYFEEVANSKKSNKKKPNEIIGYYEYYWGEVARQHNIDLANFFHPNKKIGGKGKYKNQNPGLKSLNTTYIALILSSPSFKEETIDYLDNIFVQEYLKGRSKKIGKMITRLQMVARETLQSNCAALDSEKARAVANSIRSYIVTNPKAKLPWSNDELSETKEFALQAINKQCSFSKITKNLS